MRMSYSIMLKSSYTINLEDNYKRLLNNSAEDFFDILVLRYKPSLSMHEGLENNSYKLR